MDPNSILRPLAAVALSVSSLASAHALTTAAPEAGPDVLAQHIEIQRAADRPSFHLAIDCTDVGGSRAMTLFETGVGAWNDERQFEVPPEIRRKLLTTLLGAGFPRFDPLYGARKTNDKTNGPLRISCRITLRLDDITKNVAQVADGEQFAPFVTLADELLDELEPLGQAGRSAADLTDGLAGMAEGRFAPELLVMRLMRLPGRNGKDVGRILRVEGGIVSLQAYAPGRMLTPPEEFKLGLQASALAAAIYESGFATWPINLPGDGMTELHIGVLNHGHTVTARSYSRIPAGERAAEGRALAELAADLLERLDQAANDQ